MQLHDFHDFVMQLFGLCFVLHSRRPAPQAAEAKATEAAAAAVAAAAAATKRKRKRKKRPRSGRTQQQVTTQQLFCLS